MTEKPQPYSHPMRLFPTSSNVQGVEYDEPSKRLTMHFRNGGAYHHDGVKLEEYHNLVGAESVGKHYHGHIRGKYPTTKVEPEPKEGE